MRKKHPKLLKVLISFGAFVALWSAFISTDAILAAYEKPPLFAIQVNDGVGSRHAVYIGLFYVVYVYDLPSSCIPEDPDCTIERVAKVELHNWFYPGDGIQQICPLVNRPLYPADFFLILTLNASMKNNN